MSKSTIDSTIAPQSEHSVVDTTNTQAAPQMPSSKRKGSAHASRANQRNTQSGDAAKLSAICQRLGLAGPLTFRPVKVPVDHLVIRKVDPDVLRRGRDMAASFKQVGQLANLGVVPMDPAYAPDGEAKYYEVWFGRARREGARILSEEEHCPEWEQLWCNVYDLPADPAVARKMRAAMAFIENAQRSTPWVEELRQVVELLDAGTPLTAEEFWQVFRLTPATAKALLKIAQLPRPILDQVFAGQLRSRALLNRIARLKAAQQAALVHEAQRGITITEELVGRALRGQVSQAFASPAIQAALGQGWERTADPSSLAVARSATGSQPLPEMWSLLDGMTCLPTHRCHPPLELAHHQLTRPPTQLEAMRSLLMQALEVPTRWKISWQRYARHCHSSRPNPPMPRPTCWLRRS